MTRPVVSPTGRLIAWRWRRDLNPIRHLGRHPESAPDQAIDVDRDSPGLPIFVPKCAQSVPTANWWPRQPGRTVNRCVVGTLRHHGYMTYTSMTDMNDTTGATLWTLADHTRGMT